MDGYKLAAIVQDKYPDIKIQLASGFEGQINTDIVDDNLKRNLLHKPYDLVILKQRIRELLDE